MPTQQNTGGRARAGAPDARAYWRDQMEAAMAMMEVCRTLPVQDCLEPLEDLRAAAAAAGVRLEFSQTPLAPGLARIFRLRAGLVPRLLAAAEEMSRRGWILRIEDGYRSTAMQRALVHIPAIFDAIYRKTVWELGGGAPDPELMLRRVTALVATRPKIGTHMSGSAVDISVLQMDTGAEVDRGGPYLEMSELTPMASPFAGAAARRNRQAITDIMDRHGFAAYPFEFWHYSQGDVYEVYLRGGASGQAPARYGAVDWDSHRGAVAPVAEPDAPLHSMPDIQDEIRRAMRRANPRN